jgi:hypothetical protein
MTMMTVLTVLTGVDHQEEEGRGISNKKEMIGTDLEEEDGEEDEEVEVEGGEEEEDRDSSLVNHHQYSRVPLKLQKPMHISLARKL